MLKRLDKYNLWTHDIDSGVDRLFAYPTILGQLHEKEIQVLSGIRRCGKTTLLYQSAKYLLATGIKKEQILFIPCDLAVLKLKTFKELNKLIQSYAKKQKSKIFVFLDEIQEVKGWEKYLKNVYDSQQKIKFIISGSTASFFAADVSSLLTGRHFYHRITTATFVEYLRLNPKGSLTDYLHWGGFPEVVKSLTTQRKELLLQTYIDTIIQRDILERNKLRDASVLKDLVVSIISTPGGRINPVKLAAQFNVSWNTLNKYLKLAVDAFLFDEVRFFTHSLRKNRHEQSKMYPADIGFTTLLTKRVQEGRSAEWAVLKKLKDVTYWSNSDHEIDFVTKDLAIQVTFTDDVPPREFEALAYFKKLNSKKGLVLAKSTTDKTTAVEEFLIAT